MKKSWLLFIICFSMCFFACTSNEKTINFQLPYALKNTENYEVKTIIPQKYKGYYFQVDTVSKHIYVTKALETEERNTYIKLKLDFKGNVLDSFPDNKILKDKTILNIRKKTFTEKLINGNSKFYKVYNETQNTQKKWLKKFKKMYNNSEYCYYDYLEVVYFKTKMFSKNKNEFLWYYMNDSHELINKEFRKEYPSFYKGSTKIIYPKDLTTYFFITNKNKENILSNYNYTANYLQKDTWGLTITTPTNEVLHLKWLNKRGYNHYYPEPPELYLYSMNVNTKKETLFIRGYNNFGLYCITPKEK